jgi:predicted nuclease with TOPRIM domain
MTAPHEPAGSHSNRAMWAVRRVLAPSALEMVGKADRLDEENARLRVRVEELEQRLRALEERLAGVDQPAQQFRELREGLHEERRLSLRIAELTDLVTELVLPLHDREIDPAVLTSLRPDTL